MEIVEKHSADLRQWTKYNKLFIRINALIDRPTCSPDFIFNFEAVRKQRVSKWEKAYSDWEMKTKNKTFEEKQQFLLQPYSKF